MSLNCFHPWLENHQGRVTQQLFIWCTFSTKFLSFLCLSFVDVCRGFWLSSFCVKLFLRCSQFLVGWRLCSLRVFNVVSKQLLHKSFKLVLVAFYNHSRYVHVCLTDFSHMYHRLLFCNLYIYAAYFMFLVLVVHVRNWYTNHL